MNPWVMIVVAGLLEVLWAIGLKASDGFTKLWPSVATVVGIVASMTLLSLAMRSLPVGTAYAVWVGIGAVGTAILGIVIFGEAANALRLGGIGLILAGIVALKLA